MGDLQLEPGDVARGGMLLQDVASGRVDAFARVTVSQADAFGLVAVAMGAVDQLASDAVAMKSIGVPTVGVLPATMTLGMGRDNAASVGSSIRRANDGTPIFLGAPLVDVFDAMAWNVRRLVVGARRSAPPEDWSPGLGAGEGGGFAIPTSFPMPADLLPGGASALALRSGSVNRLAPLALLAITVGGVAALAAAAWYGSERHKADVSLSVETLHTTATLALRAMVIREKLSLGQDVSIDDTTIGDARKEEWFKPAALVGGAAVGVGGTLAVVKRREIREGVAKWHARA